MLVKGAKGVYQSIYSSYWRVLLSCLLYSIGKPSIQSQGFISLSVVVEFSKPYLWYTQKIWDPRRRIQRSNSCIVYVYVYVCMCVWVRLTDIIIFQYHFRLRLHMQLMWQYCCRYGIKIIMPIHCHINNFTLNCRDCLLFVRIVACRRLDLKPQLWLVYLHRKSISALPFV